MKENNELISFSNREKITAQNIPGLLGIINGYLGFVTHLANG